VAYLIASALLWAAFYLAYDGLTGDLVSVGDTILKGALGGTGWGLVMYHFERWLRNRRAGGPPPRAAG
jgi:hypothetical protein